MYTDFYRLQGRPFQLSPNPHFFYDSRAHRRAVAYLTYGLQQAEGFIVITGDVGAGKTTLIGYLEDQLSNARFMAARVNASSMGGDDVLKLVARALGLDARYASKASLLGAIERHLHERQRQRQRVLIIVDEVQNLSLPALEELRLLSNLTADGKALVQILLVGQPQFRELLATHPELEQLRQRVVASCHLGPLDAEDVPAYVEHRLRKVGWQGDPNFDRDAYTEIFTFSRGLPRRINLLCSRLLVFGAIERRHKLTAADVREVASELDQEQAGLPDAGETTANVMPGPEPARTEQSSATFASSPDLSDDSARLLRQEVERLQRKLETVYDELGRERHRLDEVREEAERLRDALHRLELERVRVDAETTRRLSEVLNQVNAPRRGLFRRRVLR